GHSSRRAGDWSTAAAAGRMGRPPRALGRPVWSRSLQAAGAASDIQKTRRRQFGFVEAQLDEENGPACGAVLARRQTFARTSRHGRVTILHKNVAGLWNRIVVGAFRASSLFTMAGVVPW